MTWDNGSRPRLEDKTRRPELRFKIQDLRINKIPAKSGIFCGLEID